MNNAKVLCTALLAVGLAACLGSEEPLPLAIEVDDDFVARTELLGEDPLVEPPALSNLGDCGDIVGDYPALFVIGDHVIASQADAEVLYGKLAVTGRLVIDADVAVDLAALSNLRCIAGDVRIGGAGVKSLEGMHALEYVGGHLMIEDAPVLRDLRGLRDLHFVGGELRVRLAPQLVDLSGLDWLGSVGHLVVGENARLVSFDGVERLVDVNGAVFVYRNPVLADLDGLSAITCVGGEIRVLDNPRLPDCAIEAWAAPLVPNGDVGEAEIDGNDDQSSCEP